MTKKTLKLVIGLVSVLVIALTAGVVVASTKATKGELPEYLGSESCIGCHSDKFVSLESAEFSHFNSENIAARIESVADLPGDPTGIAPELAEVLAKADYYFHDRFMYQDLKTGELMYLPIEWNPTTKQYVAAPNRTGTSMDQNCGGCHAGRPMQDKAITEIGVGCESCHGPGREHVLGKGDVSKISASTDPRVSCVQCHSGNNTKTGATRYPVGYRPGMKVTDIPNFVPIVHDPEAAPQAMHHKGAVGQWEVSGHANATNLLIARGETYLNRQECIKCHSTAAGEMIAEGKTFVAKDHLVNDGVSCVACHDPHGSNNTASLKMEPQALCLSCHSVARGGAPVAQIGTTRAPHSNQGDMLQGITAIGVAPTKGAHSELSCVECHMTEGNHLMKVVKPEDVMGTTRKDSCSACHTNSSAESRDVYLSMWQESISGRVEAAKADVAVIEAALKANPDVLGDKKAAFEAARANYWYVEKDGSNGAHNFEYAIKVITKAQKDLAAIKAGLPK
ncbi:MAG TPA: ammonia-forming cytochrome c nitrite reductase subunit c552 [Symbiobacteriaceae bacterium]|nr:ammonia-forming cytochrome c nitrite reductase subunit c552 [Symbiobacteriaceae bacterium]